MLRPHQNIFLWAHLNEITQSQHSDAIGNFGNYTEIVRDKKYTSAMLPLQLTNEMQNLCLRGYIKCCCGLIGNQKHRLKHQSHSDHDALALTARELVRKCLEHALRIRKRNLFDNRKDLLLALGFTERCVCPQDLINLFATTHDRIERGHRLLENHRHPGCT